MAQVFQLAGERRTAAISLTGEVRTAAIALAGEVRTTAHRFDVVVSSGYTFLRDVNGNLILDVNGTPIAVFG